MVKVAVNTKVKLKTKLPPLEKTNNIVTKSSRTEHLKPHQFAPGNVANPAGRPKGSRNKLAENFVADILRDWEANGAAAVQQVRINDPSTYLRVVAGLIPKEFSLKDNREQSLEKFLEQLSDEQYEEYKRAVAAILALPV